MPKQSTQKLLVLLFSQTTQTNTLVGYDALEYLLPDLSEAGRRSLIAHLYREGLIRKERVEKQTLFGSTQHGNRLVTAQFPALSAQTHESFTTWSLLTFLQPPKGDPQFRYLRNLLLSKNALNLNRGVYLLSSDTAMALTKDLEVNYRRAVLVTQIGEWQFGDERSFILENLALMDLQTLYSGISNEIDGLLRSLRFDSDLNYSQKTHIFSVFDRLYSLIQKDSGVFHHYFPKSPTAIELLRRFQNLFTE